MAEVVGAVASVLALCQVVSNGVSRVVELYRAKAEIKALQEEIHLLHDVLRAVDAATKVSTQSFSRCALARAQRIIEELNELVTVKFDRQVTASGQARRRTWMKNRRQIIKLRHALREARRALSEALSVDILSSTQRLESNLTLLSQQSTRSTSNASTIDHRLRHIELPLTSQHPAICSDEAFGCPSKLPWEPLTSFSATTPSMDQPSRDLARSDNESSVDGSQSVFIPSSNTSFRHSFLPLLAPAGLLERSSNFRPETCTTRTGWSTLLHSYSREIASFEYTRILQFGFSYYKRPGEWIRFTLRITASIESKYWRFERKKTIGLNDTYSHEFPSSLMSKLASYLTDCEDLEQGSQLTVYLGKDLPEPDKGRDPMVLAIQRGRPPSQVNQYLQTITSMIYHWSDCPRYSDKALVQRPMSRHRPTNSFFAFLDERWVLASRFGCDESHIDRDRYILRALHQLRRAPGITPFLGVIFDHDSGVVTAYLCELPAKGRLSRIMADAIQSGQPITWARRERWCRQIVQGVAEMHDNDFVVGYLGEQPDAGIGIDANDNAVFFGRFQQTFWYERYGSGRLPPEYKDVKCPTEEMVATPEADIYQMGSLLWGLAVNKNGVHQTDFCKRAGCASKAGTVCSEPHADPVQLPSLGEHIPQYLNDVIAGCRHAQPRSRLPARKLYEMFPTPAEVPESQDAVEERLLRRPEECTDKYDLLVVCNLCDGKATHHYFNCDVCESSNYDLCQPCFSKGLHCLNTDHQLREHSDFHDEERYHSSVKENGQRELITACRARVDAKESGWTSR